MSCFFLGFLLAGGEIDVGQSVELRDGDVDVADADAGRENGHPLALVGAGHGVELAVGDLAFDILEMFGDEGHTARIADQNDGVGQLFGTEVEVENGAVFVDNQLGSRDSTHNGLILHFHNWHKSNIFTSNNKTSEQKFLLLIGIDKHVGI